MKLSTKSKKSPLRGVIAGALLGLATLGFLAPAHAAGDAERAADPS